MRRGFVIALTASYLAASLPAVPAGAANPPAGSAGSAGSAGPAGAAGPAAPAADKATLVKARQQFQQALALETAGDWSGASILFQQVAQVRLTPQVRFHIALCEEHLGKLAAALGHYQIAADEAQEAQASEVAAQVASRTEGLKARIPKILILRGSGADYASISLDGIALGASSIGSDLPVDPGPHTIDATSQGFKPFNAKFQIADKENKKIEVVLEALPPPPVEEKGVSSSGEAPLPPPTKNLAPFVVGGVGAASLVASGVFFLLRSKSINSLETACPDPTKCAASEKSNYDRGKTYTVVADVTLGIGIAGVAAGATLFLLNRKKPTPPTAGSVQLVPTWDSGAGAAVLGAF
jgi:hypothetical protein